MLSFNFAQVLTYGFALTAPTKEFTDEKGCNNDSKGFREREVMQRVMLEEITQIEASKELGLSRAWVNRLYKKYQRCVQIL